jgi:hypothetical protein
VLYLTVANGAVDAVDGVLAANRQGRALMRWSSPAAASGGSSPSSCETGHDVLIMDNDRRRALGRAIPRA